MSIEKRKEINVRVKDIENLLSNIYYPHFEKVGSNDEWISKQKVRKKSYYNYNFYSFCIICYIKYLSL